MQISDHALFPTRLVTIDFPEVSGLNRDLYQLFTSRDEFRGDFNMHPDALNLLSMADRCPAIARVREMFLSGLNHWLQAEAVRGPEAVEMVLFSSLSSAGDYTLVHNHNADVVGVYYVQTADYGRSPVAIPDPDGEYDYFSPGDGVLMLHDPRFNANLAAVRVCDHVKVYPRPGLMVLFPGYLWHSVTPHAGNAQRLALSANFRLRWGEGAKAEVLPLSSERGV